MNITFAVLADYASISRDGKLNIMGMFEQIGASSVPVRHPEMRLVLRMEVESAEFGRDHRIEIRCMDEDGEDLLRLEAGITIEKKMDTHASVHTHTADHILDIRGLTFKKFGGYTFSIFANNDLKKTVRFTLVDASSRQPSCPEK